MNGISEAQEYCTQGAARHSQGDLDGAMNCFDRAIEADPCCAEAWNNRAAALHLAGDHARALADLDWALELRPDYAQAYNNRGIVRHRLGDLAGALADFDRAVHLSTRYAEALNNRAAARAASGDLDGAVADLDRAIGIRPNYVEAYHSRAAIFQTQGDLEGAFTDYERILQLIPPDSAAPIYHLRGGIRFRQKRFPLALLELDRAIEIDPGSCIAYISRGNVRYHLRDRGGQVDYQTAFQIDSPVAVAEILRILVNDLREDVKEVLENCRKHVRICPDDVVAYARRGLTLLFLDREEEASRDFDAILQRDSGWKNHLELLIATVKSFRETGKPGRLHEN